MSKTILILKWVILIGILVNKGGAMSIDTVNLNKESFGIRGDDPELEKLPQYTMPIQNGDKIATLNKTGYMKVELDEFSEQFIIDAKNSIHPVLELGSAYGASAVKVLEQGGTIIANDISKEHLSVLYHNSPNSHRKRLYLNNNSFPVQTNFPANSISGVLLCRMAHFLKGEEIELGINKIHNWLIPGGKLYFVSLSPYHHLLREKFLPIYKQRFKDGDKWPGIITSMQEYNPSEKDDIPNFLHVFDIEIMSALLERHGFAIEKIKLFDYSNLSSDNLGYIGVVAKKI